MAVPQALVRLKKSEAYAAWKASDYALSELDEWCDENAEKYERTPEKLKAWIADCAANEFSRAKLDSATDAQKVAKLVGATLPKALKALVDGLSATNKKPLVDRNGNVKGVFESPNWEAINASSKEILKVLGAYAPEQLQVSMPLFEELAKKSRLEIERELADLRRSTGDHAPPGIESKDGRGELPVLAPERDEDKGRTGGDPLQAIPAAGLLSTNSRRPQ